MSQVKAVGTSIAILLGGTCIAGSVGAAYFLWREGLADKVSSGIRIAGGISIPVPWELWRWIELGAYRDGLSASINVTLACFLLFFILALVARRSDRRRGQHETTHGSAQWGKEVELERGQFLSKEGVVLARTQHGRLICDNSDHHAIVCAPTRAGKGVGIVIPTLYKWRDSVMVYDLKGENWERTSKWRAEFSHTLCFNPRDTRSVRFNPLNEVRKGLHELQDVRTIVEILTDPTGSEKKDHWLRSARSFLEGAILHVLYAEDDKSLGGVAQFLLEPGRSAEDTLYHMLSTPHLSSGKGHPVVTSVARSMLDKSDNERSGVVSTAREYISLYRDPLLHSVLGESDFRLQQFVDGDYPISLYFVVNPADVGVLGPLIRLFLSQFVARLTSSLTPRKHRVLMLLDEFAALGKLHFIESQLAYVAGYGLKVLAIVQSLTQLKQLYGSDHSILDNMNTRLFYAPNTFETAELLSKSLGPQTHVHMSHSNSGKKGAFFLDGLSVSEQRISRALLDPNEIMTLGEDVGLLLIGNRNPQKVRKVRYYLDREFQCFPEAEALLSEERPYPYRPKKLESDWERLAPIYFSNEKELSSRPGVGGETVGPKRKGFTALPLFEDGEIF